MDPSKRVGLGDCIVSLKVVSFHCEEILDYCKAGLGREEGRKSFRDERSWRLSFLSFDPSHYQRISF